MKQRRRAAAMLLAGVVLALTMTLAFAVGATPGQPPQPSDSEPSGTDYTAQQLALEREKLELDRQRLAREEQRDRYTLFAAVGAAITALTGFLTFLASQDARTRERFWGDVGALTSIEPIDRGRRLAVALSLPRYYRARSWLRPWSRPFATEVVKLVAVSLKLRGADLSGAGLTRACLRYAHLSGACLRRADLSHADLTRALLDGALLEGANLTGAGLFDAALGSADLSHADVRGACLAHAILDGADLRGADLRDAHLVAAVLTEAEHLESARFSEETVLPDGSKWRSGVELTQFTEPPRESPATSGEDTPPPTE